MIEELPGTPLSNVCSVHVERQDSTATARLYGEFDLASEERFRQELDGLVDVETNTLVIDLRGLTFMDSTGLRALIAVKHLADQDGFEFSVLCDGDGPVRRVLAETGMDDVLPLRG
jgi:anti-anti-sigma factor